MKKIILLSMSLLFSLALLANEPPEGIHEILSCSNGASENILFKGYVEPSDSSWCHMGNGSVYHNGNFIGFSDFHNCSKPYPTGIAFYRFKSPIITYIIDQFAGEIRTQSGENEKVIYLKCDVLVNYLQ